MLIPSGGKTTLVILLQLKLVVVHQQKKSVSNFLYGSITIEHCLWVVLSACLFLTSSFVLLSHRSLRQFSCARMLLLCKWKDINNITKKIAKPFFCLCFTISKWHMNYCQILLQIQWKQITVSLCKMSCKTFVTLIKTIYMLLCTAEHPYPTYTLS